MTPEEEQIAEALAIERIHGDGALMFIAQRIGAAVLAGDEAGVARWNSVAEKLEELRSRPERPN